MYVLFGTKWCKIFAGPLWSHAPTEKINTAPVYTYSNEPVKVCRTSYILYVVSEVIVLGLC